MKADIKNSILNKYKDRGNGIYSSGLKNTMQDDEIKFRNDNAEKKHDKYLNEISKHHSIAVMDKEVRKFLKKIPTNGKIIDIGGSWGWHWRNLHKIRPDIQVFITDFVLNNLLIAKKNLSNQIGHNILLIEDDATSLYFPDNSFDGVWTVQTFQHIPNFKKAVLESYRILKNKGCFINYSFNNQPIVRALYKVMKKSYPVDEYVDGQFFLSGPQKAIKDS